jgi:hypothetical protein
VVEREMSKEEWLRIGKNVFQSIDQSAPLPTLISMMG